MTTRIEVFRSVESDPPADRAFVACLQALVTSPKGKISIGANMNFYGPTEAFARQVSEDWLAAERHRLAGKETHAEAMGERMRSRGKDTAPNLEPAR